MHGLSLAALPLPFALLFSAFAVAPAPQTSIDPDRELWIRDLTVVEDSLRTTYVEGSSDPSQGAWTFGRMMEHMAGSEDPAEFTADLFSSFENDLAINGFKILARPGFVEAVIDPWREASLELGIDGLAPSVAPFRLNGIVNRMDLRSGGMNGTPISGGEGRLIYGILADGGATTTQGTIILEYDLVADDCQDILDWAEEWHALGAVPFGEQYNKRLETLVNRLAGPNAAPGRPNGSAILTVRTNDSVSNVDEEWEWREWRMQPDGFLDQTTVAMTPQSTLAGTDRFAKFVNVNEAAILEGTYEVPLTLAGQPFRGGASGDNIPGTDLDLFYTPGILNNDARHIVSLNTCVGCHRHETNTGFFHAFPRVPGNVSPLSGFLTGIQLPDPIEPGTKRQFNDLARRFADLAELLDSSCAEIATKPPLRRVHRSREGSDQNPPSRPGMPGRSGPHGRILSTRLARFVREAHVYNPVLPQRLGRSAARGLGLLVFP